MNKLRQTIQDQESVIAEQQARIAYLENDVAGLEETMDMLSVEFTQLRKEYEAKTVEAKEICDTEKAHLREECDMKILTRETKCEEERTSIESQNSQESERMSSKLDQCESTILYMGNLMVQIDEVMSERQSLVEAQATTIREADEEIKRERNRSLICEAAANTTALQAEAISSLRSTLASAIDLPQLSTADLEQLDVAPFMLELMESYNKATEVIEKLKSDLEKERMVDESMSLIADGLAKLTSMMTSATINLEIVDQQAQVIEKQGRLIAKLMPVLHNTNSDILWYEKTEAGKTGVQSVSSCSCLPRSTESGNVIPAKIEYHCGELSNRTFSLPCPRGVCKSQALPSCTEPLEWEEEESVTVSHQCQETPFNNSTLLCDGTKEVRMTSRVSGGVAVELLIVPCMDCTDLLTWTEWGPCPEDLSVDEMLTVTTRCRRRGSETFGFETEKGGVVTSPNYPHRYPPNLYPPKRQTIRAEQGQVLVLEFTAFETNCYSDHLTIEDGDGTTLLGRECGVYGQNHCDLNGQIQCRVNLPPVIRSRSNIVHLDFQTNSNIEFIGWSLNWKAVTPRV